MPPFPRRSITNSSAPSFRNLGRASDISRALRAPKLRKRMKLSGAAVSGAVSSRPQFIPPTMVPPNKIGKIPMNVNICQHHISPATTLPTHLYLSESFYTIKRAQVRYLATKAPWQVLCETERLNLEKNVKQSWNRVRVSWCSLETRNIKPLDPQTSKKTSALNGLLGSVCRNPIQLRGPTLWPKELVTTPESTSAETHQAWDWPRAPKILCVARPTWARTSPQRSGYIGATWFCGFACRSRSRVTWCRANKLNKYNFGSQIWLLWWPCQKMNAYQHTLAFCSCSLNLSVVLCPTSPNRPSCNIHSQMIVTIWIFGSYPLVI